MAFIEKGQEIDIEQIKSATILSDQALQKKNQRDQELAAIIKGEDQRLLLVIGPCSSDNEEAVLLAAWLTCSRRWRIRSLSSCGSILPSLGPMGTAIKGSFTNQILQKVQV